MQTSQLKQCTDCGSLLSLYNKVICSIFQLIKEKWIAKTYNTDYCFNDCLYSKLLRLKRILYKRLYNQKYPSDSYSNQDIISLVTRSLYKQNECPNCPCEDFTNFIADCKCYSLTNLHGPLGVTILFTYKDCTGATIDSGVDPQQTINVCALENSISQVGDNLVITLIGECTEECV